MRGRPQGDREWWTRTLMHMWQQIDTNFAYLGYQIFWRTMITMTTIEHNQTHSCSQQWAVLVGNPMVVVDGVPLTPLHGTPCRVWVWSPGASRAQLRRSGRLHHLQLTQSCLLALTILHEKFHIISLVYYHWEEYHDSISDTDSIRP